MLLQALTSNSNRIIVFLKAIDCDQGVISAIQSKTKGLAADIKFLSSLIYTGVIDIYIDGLNEVNPETRSKISDFVKDYVKANIIITTQAMVWNVPSTARCYAIEPLSRSQIEKFLISRKKIIAEDAPISNDAYDNSCRTYLTMHFEQSEDMIKIAHKVLSNPMDLTSVAHVLSLGLTPDLFNLQEQSYQIMRKEYKRNNSGVDFPLRIFSRRIYQMRLNDETILPVDDFKAEIECLELKKMVLSREFGKKDEKQSRFRHDKIMDYFIVHTFLGRSNELPQKHLGDPRFRGVYFMLATLMPLAEADMLREYLIDFAVETKDHTVSDEFIKILRNRKANSGDLESV